MSPHRAIREFQRLVGANLPPMLRRKLPVAERLLESLFLVRKCGARISGGIPPAGNCPWRFGCAEDLNQFLAKLSLGFRMFRIACQIGPLLRIIVVIVEFLFIIAAERIPVTPRTNREMWIRFTIPDTHQGHRRPVPLRAFGFVQQRPK